MSLRPPKAKVTELCQARLRESLPWMRDPTESMRAAPGKSTKTFYARHEASTLELFFDLCFVANLSVFTTYHEITTSETVFSYMGFFLILWSTWFQVTIYDARFATDSLGERGFKLWQFMAFALFAVAASQFEPANSGKAYRIWQLLAIVIGITRIFLGVQYVFVARFVVPKIKTLRLPFTIIIITFFVSGLVIMATYAGFKDKTVSKIHIVWWVVLPVELLIVVAVSSKWRELSFKATHLAERLALLTIIIIGEGVIGLTVVGIVWPMNSAPPTYTVVSLLSGILLLFLLWQSYFDCHPHGHYGTIKQQWWALAHFLLHLGYVGIAEGSNRLILFSYAMKSIVSFDDTLSELCSKTSKSTNIDYINFVNSTLQDNKFKTYDPLSYANIQELLNNATTNKDSKVILCDQEVYDVFFFLVRDALFAKAKIDPPKETSSQEDLDKYYFATFQTTYIYYFTALALTLVTAAAFIFVVRRNHRDGFEWVRIICRMFSAIVSGALILLSVDRFQDKLETAFLNFLSSRYVVLVVCGILIITIVTDMSCRRLGIRYYCRRWNRPDVAEDDHDGHDHDGHDHENTTHHLEPLVKPDAASYEPYGYRAVHTTTDLGMQPRD